ncbi:hypothetical protein BpHYR1_045010 [Brachionus plicatilis]|uniref:Uncharacterized protein n=1 Tax=Brachionus plicatilis TaxID=10195 RepID=A0A3M7PUX7_BRAPC|nr:hypothetical protein BpHYR1_045010 [Brachionus plicatilis]
MIHILQTSEVVSVAVQFRDSHSKFHQISRSAQLRKFIRNKISIYSNIGVMFDDEIKKTKELERKKWLHDLEEQKKEKLVESQQPLKQFYQDNHPALNTEQKNLEEKSFGRTRNLLDPAQIDELERRKKQGLQHKLEIEAQIAEKKRIKMIEEEIQNLNNMKVENEALELKQASKLNEEKKKQNSHYQNFEKILNSSRPSNVDVSPSVLQGEYNKHDQETKTMRSNITETRSQEIYRKMQEAELAAAEEKHKKLLKRLQKGGHDTSQLEKKFAELKAKLTRNPEHLMRDTSPHIASHNFNEPKSIESTRMNNNSSHMSHMNEMEPAYKKALYKSLESNEKKNEGESIEQIFKLLRMNSAGLPAEIKEEDLRLLLKNAVKSKDNSSQRENKNDKNYSNNKMKEVKDYEEEKLKVGVGKDGKPIWNFKNLKGKKAVSNSQKDPFYFKRAQQAEERKIKRMEYYKNFSQREKNRSKEQNENFSSYRSDRTNEENFNLALDNEDDNVQLMSRNSDNKVQTESIMNLLGKNLAKTPIYEEDEDLYLHQNYPSKIADLNIKDPSFFNGEENSSRGFVPFMRTNEILDPVHAGSPVPPSRESSAVKRDRERARQMCKIEI